MSAPFAIHLDVRDRATPVVQALARAAEPAQWRALVGRTATNAFRAHFRAVNRAKPNALGGTRTNYYAAAAGATDFVELDDGILLSVRHAGITQHVLGGTITPKQSKFLTIPARAEAHGKRAREFSDLIVVYNRRGRPIALARAGQSLIGFRRDGITRAVVGVTRKGNAGGEILFWLVDSVTQQPDPSIVPTDFELMAAIISAINDHFATAEARAGLN